MCSVHRHSLHQSVLGSTWISIVTGGIAGATRSGMSRDVKTVPRSRQSSSTSQPPLQLFDPYSQQMIVCTKPGGDTTAGGTSKASLLLQLALLSSVAVMVWYMLRILAASE
jgi:hypothetical protein